MAETDTQPMVEARDLHKFYGSTRAVNGVSFQVRKGEILGFLGPNGAGKTTTMQMLTGFLRPSGGHAFVGGISVEEDALAAQEKIGYLPESAPLYDDMMVVDFLDYIAALREVPLARRRPRMREICERCGLGNVLGKDIGQLSKGFRQRVGLAQAMIHDPDLVILDEPTSGLDPNQIVEIRQLIKDLGREKTVILSTHILPEVQATCGRIIIINDGKLVADDSPEALTEQEAGAVISVVVTAKEGAVDGGQVKEVLGNLPGVRRVDETSLLEREADGAVGFSLRARGQDDPRPAIFNAAVQNDLILIDMHRDRVSLEDTFRRLTRGDATK